MKIDPEVNEFMAENLIFVYLFKKHCYIRGSVYTLFWAILAYIQYLVYTLFWRILEAYIHYFFRSQERYIQYFQDLRRKIMILGNFEQNRKSKTFFFFFLVSIFLSCSKIWCIYSIYTISDFAYIHYLKNVNETLLYTGP